MHKILIIGASGFVGRRLARAALAAGHVVRCLARTPARVQDLAAAGCEVVQGDLADPASMQRALDSVHAAYLAVHTLSPQAAGVARRRFMELEEDGVRSVVAAARTHGVRRLVYVTSLGIAPDAPGEWLRGRWRTEQLLLESGLDATIIRPGMIVGAGGRGFDSVLSNARRRVAVLLGDGRQAMRTIAVDDLVYYLLGVLDEPRARRQRYDVGSDDVLTVRQMIDIAAETLGRARPAKIPVPYALLGVLAPVIERASHTPRGAIRGFLDGGDADMIGDPTPIRALLPRTPTPYRAAVEGVLADARRC